MSKLLGIKQLCEFWQAIKAQLNLKVDKVTGKGLSTNDFTTAEKNKLAGIQAGAEVNVQSDWNQTNTSADDFIKNKPTIPTRLSQLTNDSDFVEDPDYVHTDNNFTTAEKNKLAGIASGAEVNVQSDWNQTNTTEDDYIKNKPTIPAATTTTPKMDGTAAVGTETKWARGDHVHPHDSAKVNVHGGALYNGTLAWPFNSWSADAETTLPRAELRNMGAEPDLSVGFAYRDANNNTTTHVILNKNGDFIPEKAPTNHASSAATYGLGSTSNYGHVKTVNNLTQSSHADGLALSAYQGYRLLQNYIKNFVIFANKSVANQTIGVNTAKTISIDVTPPSGYEIVGWGSSWFDGTNTSNPTSCEHLVVINIWQESNTMKVVIQNLSTTATKRMTVHISMFYRRVI